MTSIPEKPQLPTPPRTVSRMVVSVSLGVALGVAEVLALGVLALAVLLWMPMQYAIALGYGALVFGVLLLSTFNGSLPGAVERTVARPVWLVRTGGVIAFVLFVMASLFFTAGQETASTGLDWAYAGGIVTVGAMLVHWSLTPAPSSDDLSGNRFLMTHTRWLPLVIGVLLLWFLAEISGRAYEIYPLLFISSNVQFLILILGVGLVGYGLAGQRYTQVYVRAKGDTVRVRTPVPGGLNLRSLVRGWDRAEVIALVVIMLIALGLRIYELGTAQRLFIDEVHFSNPVTHFFSNDNVRLFQPFSSVAAFPYLFPYMQAHGVFLFGSDLFGLRIISAVFGTANVLALYLLARTAFNVRVALLSAALLAALPVHIQFSRLGLNNVVDPVFGTLACYFVLRGLKYPDQMRGHFAWAGVMIGLTQYFYEGGRFMYAPLIVGWLVVLVLGLNFQQMGRALAALIDRDRNALMRALTPRRFNGRRALFAFGAAAIFVGMPVYYTLIAQDWSISVRLETAGVGQRVTKEITTAADFLDHFSDRFNEAFLIHVSIPEAQLYYGGHHPFLMGFMIPFAGFGFFYLVAAAGAGWLFHERSRQWQIMRAAATLLFLWVMLTWMGNALMQESRISARYVVAFPALALIVAIGMDQVATLTLPRDVPTQKLLLAISITVLVTLQGFYYFGPYMQTFNEQFRADRGRNLDVEDALFRSRDFPDYTHVTIVDDPAWYNPDVNNLLQYLRGDPVRTVFIEAIKPEEFTAEFINQRPLDRPNAFFIGPDDTESIERLLTYLPSLDGPQYTEFDASKERGFVLYFMPQATDSTAVGAAE